MSQPSGPENDTEQPFISHLIELRERLLRVVLAVLLVFLVLFPFANDIYHVLAQPLLAHMPEGTSMIATEVASPFLTPFKLVLVAAIFLAIPYILYQVWGFVAPGLYRHEQRLVLPLVVSSTLLYFLGMAFAYFVVFPLVFGFFIGVAPEGVAVMTDIAKYLDFVLKLFFAFGVAFEVPVATVLLVMVGITTPDALAQKRPYVIVGAFVIGMLLTPPDVVSQTLLALPMWVLFEVGIVMSRVVARRRREAAAAEGDDPDDPGSGPGQGPAGGSGQGGPSGGTGGASQGPEAGAGGPGGAAAGAMAAGGAVAAAAADPAEAQPPAPTSDSVPEGLNSPLDEDDDEDLEAELDRAIAEEERNRGKEGEDEPQMPADDDFSRFTEEGLDDELDALSGEVPSEDRSAGTEDAGRRAAGDERPPA
jgi:sec-independent protein translocase protein TatC